MGIVNGLRALTRASGRALFRAAASVLTALTSLRHSAASGGWAILNRTGLNFAGLVRPEANSIVQACIRWAQRNFIQAPPILESWNEERQDWDQHQRDEVLNLLDRPNPYYPGAVLFGAMIADYVLSGDGYMIKVRSATGRVVQLWWAPASTMEPMGDPNDATVFISHYNYSPGGGGPIPIRVEDVVHVQDGMDPANPRRGFSAMQSLFREIFTDDEAANMTASLLRNAGVPGVIITPEHGNMSLQAAQEVKAKYMQLFGGDKNGEPLVLAGAAKVTQFGFSPEQMQMRALRGIPEERITAAIGINSAVLGLGSGLSTTKVGATLKEYGEQATESFMVPLWQNFGAALTHQLLGDFRVGQDWRCIFNLANVRVLQEDEERRAENLGKRLGAGGITVAEYRRALGMIALPEHEVYLRSTAVVAVPAHLSPQEQAAASAPAPAPAGLNPAAAVGEAERVVRSPRAGAAAAGKAAE